MNGSDLRCEVAGSIRTLSDRIPTARTTFPMARASSRLGGEHMARATITQTFDAEGNVRTGESDRGRVMTLTEHESTAAVKEALVSLVATAKRCPRVTAKLSTDEPTMYDRRHA